MSSTLIAALAIGTLIIVGALGLRPFLKWLQDREARQAIREFRLRREALEAKFFDVAASVGKPRGLRWKECDWQDSVTFGRDVQTQLLTAFASVEIHFEAVEGGDMEDVEAVSTIRDASAVFHYQKGRWGTGGRALFNMNPDDAITHLQGQYEPVNSSVAPGNL